MYTERSVMEGSELMGNAWLIELGERQRKNCAMTLLKANEVDEQEKRNGL
jgi:hypothetical protein